MLVVEFFGWWYSQGWALLIKNARKRVMRTSHLFSLPILLRTLFAPWKRIISDPGAGLEAHVRAATDNLVSRAIGFVVRLGVLFCALVIIALVFIIAILQIIIWPLMPVGIVALLVKGIL
jgi:hypothetical protein